MELPPGVTERQKNHWVAQGWIFDDDRRAPGRGHSRAWEPVHYRRLTAIALLRSVGFELEAAGKLARRIADSEEPIKLGSGLMLVILPEDIFGQKEEQ
jgi:hypothetical protein